MKYIYQRSIKGCFTIIKYPISLLFILLLINSKSYGQTLSLDSIFNKIENNNSSLRSYQNKIKAEDELVNGASMWMAPTLSAEWDDIMYKFDAAGSQMRITVMQQFPNPRVIQAKENYLKSASSITKNQGEFEKNELFQQAKEAYYNRYIAAQNSQILEANKGTIEVMITLAEKQIAIGKLDLASIYKLKARLSENKNMLLREKNMIHESNLKLNYLMNQDLNSDFEIDTSNLIKNYQQPQNSVKLDSLDCNRSDILTMNSQINTMKLKQSLTYLNALPNYGIRIGNFTRFGGRSDAFAIMGTMSIPIAPWYSKGYKSEINSMGYEIKAMEQSKQNMLKMAKQMIALYLSEMQLRAEELRNYREEVIPAYQNSLNLNLLSYGQNTGELTMTLLAWDDLQMAQLAYLKVLSSYLSAQSQYEKAFQIQ